MDLWGDNIHSCNECKNDFKQWKEDEKDIFTIDMIQASTFHITSHFTWNEILMSIEITSSAIALPFNIIRKNENSLFDILFSNVCLKILERLQIGKLRKVFDTLQT